MGASTITTSYHAAGRSLQTSGDTASVLWEVVIVYRGTNGRGGIPSCELSRLTKEEADKEADKLRLRFADVDDVLNVVVQPMEQDEPEPPRRFYPTPRNNEEAMALFPRVWQDIDARLRRHLATSPHGATGQGG